MLVLGFAYETLVFINRCAITNLLPSKFWQVPSIKDPRARPFEHAITHMSTCSLSELYSLPNAHVIAGAGLL
jgi:hypothetical protein